jgi:hypothetical protein
VSKIPIKSIKQGFYPMFKVKMLIITAFCVLNAGMYAMQYEATMGPDFDIIDNAPFDNSLEAQERRLQIVRGKETRNKKRSLALRSALPRIATSQQAWTAAELATNSGDTKLARKLARTAVRLEDLEAGVQPVMAPRALNFDED